MKHSLLKRQVKKYLSEQSLENEEFKAFLNAVENSYESYDDQIQMIVYASELGSEELKEANKTLKEETEAQKKILNELNAVVTVLNEFKLEETVVGGEFTGKNAFELLEIIRKQTDIIKQSELEQIRLVESLKVSNVELEDYAHAVSHDLKSPLRSLDTLINWILEDNRELFNKETLQTFTMLLDKIEKMENLITGILEFSSINKREDAQEYVDLNKVVKNIDTMIPKVGNKMLIIDGRLPIIRGDYYRFHQLFYNLIANGMEAVSDENGLVKVQAEVYSKGWVFNISDNGIGIEEEDQEEIFKVFKSIGKGDTSSGIGLSLVKKIVEYYGGEIWIDCDCGEDEGATFSFTLDKCYESFA